MYTYIHVHVHIHMYMHAQLLLITRNIHSVIKYLRSLRWLGDEIF